MTPISNTQRQDQPAPAYTFLDTNDPDGQFATNVGHMITSHCRNDQGSYNQPQVRKLLDMVINYVKHETGVLPSLTTTSATSIPTSNNPTNPDEWDWSQWTTKYLPKRGMYEMGFRNRQRICMILGAGLEKDLIKVNTILEHQLFKESVRSKKISGPFVKNIVYSAKTCDAVVNDLFRFYEPQLVFNPTGMIKAAITLGYLPREDIQQLYDMSE